MAVNCMEVLEIMLGDIQILRNREDSDYEDDDSEEESGDENEGAT
jgi:hypothetical protein